MDVLRSVAITEFTQRLLGALALVFDDCSYSSVSQLVDREERTYELIAAARVHSSRPRSTPDIAARLAARIREHEQYCKVQDGCAAGHVLADTDLMTRRQVIESAPYREVYESHNVGFTAGFTLPSESLAASPYFVAVFRNGTPFRPREIASLTALRDQLVLYAPAARRIEPPKALQHSPARASRLVALGLRPSEAAVLFWVAEGKRDSEIAIILGKSVRTVHVQVRSILGALHVETRTAAAAIAIELLRDER